MADPLSVIASLLAVATAGVQSTRSLKEAAKRYKTRDATLRRLLDEIEDTENILGALEQLLEAATSEPALATDASMAKLLRGPIARCSKVCSEFEEAMAQFSRKSKTGFIDWAKMEFMRGDFNQFIEYVAGYKATISVGLGVLTMRTVKLSRQALEEYDEMVKNTTYNLNIRLQRIDEKLERRAPSNDSRTPSTDIDLNSERQVTEQCLQICEDAKSYLESLANRDAALLQEAPSGLSANLQEKFEAQLLTRRALDDNQDSLVKIIGRLRERLEAVVLGGDTSERSRLEEDIQTSKQCLEVCKLASSEVTHQKIHIVGEVVADGGSDQVVVTTLADMFNVGKAISKNRSALLVGSMSDEALMQLSRDRYNSRFGTANTDDHVTHGRVPVVNSETSNTGPRSPRPTNNRQLSHHRSPPSSNETRKRVADLEAHADKSEKSSV